MTNTRRRPAPPELRVGFLLRLSPDLKAKLEKLARQEHRSLNRQIEFLLERATCGNVGKETGAQIHTRSPAGSESEAADIETISK